MTQQKTPAQQAEEHHHGKTPAAWVGSILASVGFLVSSVGFVMNIAWVVVWIGFALVALGIIAGGLMRKMGYGQA